MSMIIMLIINAHMIFVIPSYTYLPTIERTGYANIEQWYGGNLIYAHNYLSGSEFYDADFVTVIYEDGTSKEFEVKQSIIIDNKYWENTLLEYSSLDTITLATCYTSTSIFIVELKEVTFEYETKTIK